MITLAYTSDDTTWIAGTIPLILGLCLCAAAIAMWRKRRQERRQREAFRAQQRARRAALAIEADPVEHEGATEAYGAVLQQVGKALPSADLRTTGEQMVADHAELAGISDAMDACDERIMHKLRLFCGDDLELFMQLTRWGGATLEDTGTFPVVRAEVPAGAR